MCSYFAPNGVSSCGNEYLMNFLIREKWERPDAVVMSDCSAVGNMMKNVMHLNQTQASAQAMNAGLDVYGKSPRYRWHRVAFFSRHRRCRCGQAAGAITCGGRASLRRR